MEPLDGLYRHGGAVVTWDGEGVTLGRTDQSVTSTLRWDQIAGARRVGDGAGYVQLLLQGHEPTDDYQNDRLTFSVNSDHDANRLLTSIRWYSAAMQAPSRRSRTWLVRLRRAGSLVSRSPAKVFGRRGATGNEADEQ